MRMRGGVVVLHIAAECCPPERPTPTSLEAVSVYVSHVAKGLRSPVEWSWGRRLLWAIQMGAN